MGKKTFSQQLNFWVYKAQLAYMQKRRTTETVGLHQAFFHITRNDQKILKKYNQRLKGLGLK